MEGSHDVVGVIKCLKFEVLQLFSGITDSKLEGNNVPFEGSLHDSKVGL